MECPDISSLSSAKLKSTWFKKHYPEMYEYLMKYPPNLSWSERVYWFYHKLSEHPKCKICNSNTKYINITKGYRTYCCQKCAMSDAETIGKIKNTMYLHYGVDVPLRCDEIRIKAEQTCIKKYGVKNPFSSPDIIKKIKDTNIKKYGAEYATQNPEVHKKVIDTQRNKYGGVGFESSEIMSKCEKTNITKYGVPHPIFNSDTIIDHIPNENGEYKRTCPHPECNKCSERYYWASHQIMSNRKLTNTELCTRLLAVGHDTNRGTTIELFVRNLLDTYHIDYECNNKSILNGKEIDIYVPSKKIGIECNGIYWHSTSSPNKKPISYHFNKWKECKENGIQLLTVWEDQIINKPEIVESIILSKLGIYERRIYARNCQVREVDSKECYSFLKAYHLQGASNSKVRYGLYYKDELVSVMTFGLKRKCMGGKGEWELHRYCNKKGVQVVGGASRLFKHFLNAQKPIFIESFSSNDISDGGLYDKLGFDMLKCEYGSYWYIDKDMNRYHRYNFRKDQLVKEGFDASKSEFTIMEERGYYRIYDTGQTKWYTHFDYI